MSASCDSKSASLQETRYSQEILKFFDILCIDLRLFFDVTRASNSSGNRRQALCRSKNLWQMACGMESRERQVWHECVCRIDKVVRKKPLCYWHSCRGNRCQILVKLGETWHSGHSGNVLQVSSAGACPGSAQTLLSRSKWKFHRKCKFHVYRLYRSRTSCGIQTAAT